jgi:hypothetical protein
VRPEPAVILHSSVHFPEGSTPETTSILPPLRCHSGGPLLDQAGNVVGVVTAKMNAVKMAKHTGDIPQNVNFALKASLVGDMLEVKDIDYETAPSKKKMETANIFDKAKKFTVLVECLQ